MGHDWVFEVLDLDGKRIDKVLAQKDPAAEHPLDWQKRQIS